MSPEYPQILPCTPNFSQPLGDPLVAWQPLEMWGGLRQPAELQEEAEGLWTVLEGS